MFSTFSINFEKSTARVNFRSKKRILLFFLTQNPFYMIVKGLSDPIDSLCTTIYRRKSIEKAWKTPWSHLLVVKLALRLVAPSSVL